MKKSALIIIFFALLFSCKKSVHEMEAAAGKSLVGRWFLSDAYASPGTGVEMNAIPWAPVQTGSGSSIIFDTDGKTSNNLPGDFQAERYPATDSTIVFTNDNKQLTTGYKISGKYLEIYGNLSFEFKCDEFCGSRFVSDPQ